MKLPEQTLILQWLENSYIRELNELVAADAVKRLWSKDVSLWPPDEAGIKHISSNLNWLDLADQVGAQIARVSALVAEAEAEGFEDIVFVALGDSNLAANAVLNTSLEKRVRDALLFSIAPIQGPSPQPAKISICSAPFSFLPASQEKT